MSKNAKLIVALFCTVASVAAMCITPNTLFWPSAISGITYIVSLIMLLRVAAD